MASRDNCANGLEMFACVQTCVVGGALIMCLNSARTLSKSASRPASFDSLNNRETQAIEQTFNEFYRHWFPTISTAK